jgi:hypothetical protein
VSIPEPANLRPHDLAKAEIDAWRGRCLNIFARAEKAITETLALLRETDPTLPFEPLAGQRFNTLDKIALRCPATGAQQKGLQDALIAWRELDVLRPFFSHGIVTEMIGRTGQWHIQLDFIAVKKGQCQPQRLNWSNAEALEFEERLYGTFKRLTNQLGLLRKRSGSNQNSLVATEPKKPDPGSSPG